MCLGRVTITQLSNAYLQYKITKRKAVVPANPLESPDSVFFDGDQIRQIIIASAYTFIEARLAMTGVSDLENKKYIGHVSGIMRLLTTKHGDLSHYLQKVNVSEAENNNRSLKQIFSDNHTIAANEGTIKGQLALEHFFGFCKTYKKTL